MLNLINDLNSLQLLTTKDVARILRFSEFTVRKLVRLGKLKPAFTSPPYRFHPAQIKRLLQSAEVVAEPEVVVSPTMTFRSVTTEECRKPKSHKSKLTRRDLWT